MMEHGLIYMEHGLIYMEHGLIYMAWYYMAWYTWSGTPGPVHLSGYT